MKKLTAQDPHYLKLFHFFEHSLKINNALVKAEANRVNGKELTPFLIKEINNFSNNKTLTANVSLIINNAKLAGKIAKDFYN